MSNFHVFRPGDDGHIKAMLCTLTGMQNCTLTIGGKVQDLINLTMFLQVAIDQDICQEEPIVESVKWLRGQILLYIQSTFDCFKDVDFEHPETFFKGVSFANQMTPDPALESLLRAMFEEIESLMFDSISSNFSNN